MNRLFGFIVFVFSFSAHADEPSALSETLNTLTRHTNSAGIFTQERHLKGFSKALISSGSYLHSIEHGLFWEVQKPFYHASTFGKTKTISWRSPSEISNTEKPNFIQRQINDILLAVLSGDMASLGHHFEISEKKASEDNSWSISLTPTEKAIAKQIKYLELEVGRALNSITITSRKGELTRIEFAKQEKLDQLTVEQCDKFYPSRTTRCE